MGSRPLVPWLTVPFAVLLFAGFTSAKGRISDPCQPGRFLLPAGSQLIPGGAPIPIDAVVLQGKSVGIDSGCALIAGKVKLTRKGTRVTSKWATCGGRQKVQLHALLAPDCDTLAGTLRAKRVKPDRFTAKRSVCGDDVLDRGNDEECDGLGGCGEGTCTGHCRCEPVTSTTTPTSTSVSSSTTITSSSTTLVSTTSVPEPTSTLILSTTTTSSTTTSSTTTSSTTTLPATCGDGTLNQPSEECDGADAYTCPDACRPDCTCPDQAARVRFRVNLAQIGGRPGHEGFVPTAREPIAGQKAYVVASVLGPYATVAFQFVDSADQPIETVDLTQHYPLAATNAFVGRLDVPAQAFKIAASGTTRDGSTYDLIDGTLFTPQPIGLSWDPYSLSRLSPGGRTTLRFDLVNHGVPDTFFLSVSDTLGLTSGATPDTTTLGTNEAASIVVEVSAPNYVPRPAVPEVNLTATSVNQPGITNSFSVRLTLDPGTSP